MQCQQPGGCTNAFHVLCARNIGLYLSEPSSGSGELSGRHTRHARSGGGPGSEGRRARRPRSHPSPSITHPPTRLPVQPSGQTRRARPRCSTECIARCTARRSRLGTRRRGRSGWSARSRHSRWAGDTGGDCGLLCFVLRPGRASPGRGYWHGGAWSLPHPTRPPTRRLPSPPQPPTAEGEQGQAGGAAGGGQGAAEHLGPGALRHAPAARQPGDVPVRGGRVGQAGAGLCTAAGA